MSRDEFGRESRTLRVFISSPGDVKKEREAVRRVLEEINTTLGSRLNLFLHPVRWETFRPNYGTVEEHIRRQLRECDLFIMIFHRKFGTPPTSDGEFKSGTEMEYRIAEEMRRAADKPEIFVYFKEIDDSELLKDPGPELAKVLALKAAIRETVFYRTYPSIEIFPYELKDHVITWLLDLEEMRGQETKREALRTFFSLGRPRRLSRPAALIIYPRLYQTMADVTHLLPYMILEDFQAIHKLTKCLNIAGCTDVSTVTTDEYDRARERTSNKVFLCVPRNRPAHACLAELDNVRFRVDRSDGKAACSIAWLSDKGEELLVESPQSKYLTAQREGSEQWKENPGKCYAVDFGILARFDSPDAKREPELGNLKKFFLFGIRGLGTWGAAWYLDRCLETLVGKFSDSGPIQMLLKITYRDFRIRSVEDVSGMSQEFFDRENDQDEIQKILVQHGEP